MFVNWRFQSFGAIGRNSVAEIQKVYGERLRAIRLQKGVSQEALADAAELHRTYVSSVERGERNISLVNIGRLADALGVPIRDFFPDK